MAREETREPLGDVGLQAPGGDIKGVFEPLVVEDAGWLVAIIPVTMGKGVSESYYDVPIGTRMVLRASMRMIANTYSLVNNKRPARI